MTVTKLQAISTANSIFDTDVKSIEELSSILEGRLEDRLKTFLPSLGIRSSVKTNKKSLRVKRSIGRKKYLITSFGDVFDLDVLVRSFVRELLEDGSLKIRFFVTAEPILQNKGEIVGYEYTINWYNHVS